MLFLANWLQIKTSIQILLGMSWKWPCLPIKFTWIIQNLQAIPNELHVLHNFIIARVGKFPSRIKFGSMDMNFVHVHVKAVEFGRPVIIYRYIKHWVSNRLVMYLWDFIDERDIVQITLLVLHHKNPRKSVYPWKLKIILHRNRKIFLSKLNKLILSRIILSLPWISTAKYGLFHDICNSICTTSFKAVVVYLVDIKLNYMSSMSHEPWHLQNLVVFLNSHFSQMYIS